MGNGPWHLTKVNNSLTLESIDNGIIEIPKGLFNVLGSHKPLEDELENYNEKEKDIENKMNESVEAGGFEGRRVYCAWQSTVNDNKHCMTLMHFLFRPSKNVMNVYQRSSDVVRLSSDLVFYAKMGTKYNIDTIYLMIGSLHVYV